MRIVSNFSNFDFNVDSISDPYGVEYWKSFANGSYEPDTTQTLLSLCDNQTIFFDVGAATGTMTLMAASQGSRVISYEPISEFYNALHKNLNLNPQFKELVVLRKAIISTRNGVVSLATAVGESISSIVFDPKNVDEEFVEEVRLRDEITKFYTKEFKLVLKIDIEGAEYNILKDVKLLKLLQELKADVILAIHPGFFRTSNKRSRKTRNFNHGIFLLRNYKDNWSLYRRITPFARIARTNRTVVNSSSKFALMSAAGVLEYYLTFREDQ